MVRFSYRFLLLFGVLVVSPVILAADAAKKAPVEEEKEMTIGSLAPPIDIEHWLSTGDGKFQPFHEFEPGKVYVVEFWATWCGPCIMSMPHLVELQHRYVDRGVTVVSVSDEPLETVEGFLKREVMQPRGSESEEPAAEEGKAKPTYAELTSAYCLTTDPDASVKKDYFQAAGQSGIPCAFVVGKDGKIEWIGHPMAMDEPLEAVVAGTWDRETFAAEFKQTQLISRMFSKGMRAARAGDYAKFDEVLAELQNLEVSPEMADRVKNTTAQLKNIALSTMFTNDPQRAISELQARAADFEPRDLSAVGMQIAQMKARGGDIKPELLAAVTKMIEDSSAGQPDALALFALAQLSHAGGDLDKAIAYLQEAAASEGVDPRMKPAMEQMLKKWEEEKANAAAPPAAEAPAETPAAS